MFSGTVVAGMLPGIQKVVPGKHWHDLGAGGLHISRLLMKWGARGVTAIDRHEMPPPPQGVETRQCYFEDYHDPIEHAFVSWPANWKTDIPRLVSQAKTIIYLGLNTDSTACGHWDFWQLVRSREVLFHYPYRRNTMVIYGEDTGADRPGLPDEMAGVLQQRVWSFEEAQQEWGDGGRRQGQTLGSALDSIESLARALSSSAALG